MKGLLESEAIVTQIFFVRETIQGGKIRPSTYVHEISISLELYSELRDEGIINHESLATYKTSSTGKRIWDPIAFFEFRQERCIVSFSHFFNWIDFRTMIDRYLIMKAYGEYPLKFHYESRLNQDKRIELLVNQELGSRNKEVNKKIVKRDLIISQYQQPIINQK